MGLVNIGIKSEGLLEGESSRLGMTKITLSASTYVMTVDTTHYIVLDGTTSGQVLRLPNATTLQQGHQYFVVNDSTSAFVSMYYNDGTTLLITLPPNTRTHVVAKTITTSNGVWIIEQSSSSTLSSTSYLSYYGGNANVGRYLQYVPGEDTSAVPYLVVGNSAIVALSLGATSASTGTMGIFKSTDLVTPITTITLTAQISNSVVGIYVPVNNGDRLASRVTSGSISKPYLTTYLVGR